MKRRDVLKGVAAAGVGASIAGQGAGCVPARFAADTRVMPDDLDAFLATFDRGVAVIDDARFVEGIATHVGKTLPPDELARSEDLVQRMLRSLFVSATFSELPLEAQIRPEVQARLRRYADEIDDTMNEVTDLLAALTPEERLRVRSTLKREPAFGMKVAETIDDHAAMAGLSTRRRLQFRSIMTQTTFRLRHQSPDVLIDEYVAKARRVQAEPPSDLETRRRLVAAVGDAAFWELQARGGGPPAPQGVPSARSSPPGSAPRQQAAPPPAPVAKKERSYFGLKLIGYGVVVFAVSALFVANDVFPFVFGMTVGAVMFVVGLIVALIQAIYYGVSRPEKRRNYDEGKDEATGRPPESRRPETKGRGR